MHGRLYRPGLAPGPVLWQDQRRLDNAREIAMITNEEALRAGRQSVWIFGIAAVVICTLTFIVGKGHFGTKPEYATPPAATTGSANP
jgi:hypothetical protein